jgi:hypothetical protein
MHGPTHDVEDSIVAAVFINGVIAVGDEEPWDAARMFVDHSHF